MGSLSAISHGEDHEVGGVHALPGTGPKKVKSRCTAMHRGEPRTSPLHLVHRGARSAGAEGRALSVPCTWLVARCVRNKTIGWLKMWLIKKIKQNPKKRLWLCWLQLGVHLLRLSFCLPRKCRTENAVRTRRPVLDFLLGMPFLMHLH